MTGTTLLSLTAAAVSPLCVRQWSSRMGGPSGAEIGRMCRGV